MLNLTPGDNLIDGKTDIDTGKAANSSLSVLSVRCARMNCFSPAVSCMILSFAGKDTNFCCVGAKKSGFVNNRCLFRPEIRLWQSS